jgi:hypothetical protein
MLADTHTRMCEETGRNMTVATVRQTYATPARRGHGVQLVVQTL